MSAFDFRTLPPPPGAGITPDQKVIIGGFKSMSGSDSPAGAPHVTEGTQTAGHLPEITGWLPVADDFLIG